MYLVHVPVHVKVAAVPDATARLPQARVEGPCSESAVRKRAGEGGEGH